MRFGTTELLVVLAIVLIIFGASRLPQLGRGLGEGIRNFRKGVKNDEPTPVETSKREPGA